MTIKTLLTASAVVLVTATSSFASCQGGKHESASMSCADGTIYDAASNTCKVVSG